MAEAMMDGNDTEQYSSSTRERRNEEKMTNGKTVIKYDDGGGEKGEINGEVALLSKGALGSDEIRKDYVEEVEKEEKIEDDIITERKVDYQTVVVVEATSDLRFYAQIVDQGSRLEALMSQIRQEFQTNPPLPGACTPRKVSDFKCNLEKIGREVVEPTSVGIEPIREFESFLKQLRFDMNLSRSSTGSEHSFPFDRYIYTAKYEDDQWYRAKVEKGIEGG